MYLIYSDGTREEIGPAGDTACRAILKACIKARSERWGPSSSQRVPVALTCSEIEYYGVRDVGYHLRFENQPMKILYKGLPLIITHLE